jgi:hypothetical protein
VPPEAITTVAPRCLEVALRITRITMPCMTLLTQLCPRPSCVVFEDGRFALHAAGNGTGTQVDARTLEQLMRLRVISRVRDVDPAQYVINAKGRGALKMRATVTGNYRCPCCPHPDGCLFDGQCLCHVSHG